jgi:hypothetical protein
MNSQKGFIVPAAIVLGVVLIGAGVMYYRNHPTPDETTNSATTTNQNLTNSSGVTPSVGSSVTSANSVEANVPQKSTHQNTEGLVQVADVGTAAQRFNLETLTNADYSYAISFPREWSASGASNAWSVTNGRSVVFIGSYNLPSGFAPVQFAAQDGVTNTFPTTEVNAYNAAEVASGNLTTYYIVNGSVGYKIVVSDAGDTETLNLILLTFTVTKQR